MKNKRTTTTKLMKWIIAMGLSCIQFAVAYPTITEINPTIDSLMKQVNIDSLETKIRYLQDLGPRPASNTGIYAEQHKNNIEARNWLYQQYENIDNLDVYWHHFLPESQLVSPWQSMNVVAVQTGIKYPNEYIIICSHFDSKLNSPGADDNASGTSGVLEIAKILSSYTFKRSIIYINFNGEEDGLIGSSRFVNSCKKNNINILGIFNLDMIGYNPIDEPLKIYYNDRPLISKEFANYFGIVANLYLSDISILPCKPVCVACTDFGGGDDVSFISNNYPAILLSNLLTEKNNSWAMQGNPCYHKPCDTIGIEKADAGVNSMKLVKAYTQATLVAVAELAELDFDSIEEESLISSIRIIPNPVDLGTIIEINCLEKQANTEIKILDLSGREILLVYSGLLDEGINNFPLPNSYLSNGSYILSVQNNNGQKVEKFVIAR